MTYQNRLNALREDHDLNQTKVAEVLNVIRLLIRNTNEE